MNIFRRLFGVCWWIYCGCGWYEPQCDGSEIKESGKDVVKFLADQIKDVVSEAEKESEK